MIYSIHFFAQTVTIGTQVWSIKNLNVTTFRNGDAIKHAETFEEWKEAGLKKEAAWCYYQNNPSYGAKYGLLYNWYAVNDPRGLAPIGFHVPTIKEWTIMSNYIGGKDLAGTKLKSTSGWFENRNGTNSFGFSGLPGGGLDIEGEFYGLTEFGFYWSSTEASTNDAWYCGLDYLFPFLDITNFFKKNGFSVRCIKD